jgi:hypothetical protein
MYPWLALSSRDTSGVVKCQETVEEILAALCFEDLERADILTVLGFVTRLSQVKRMQPGAV